MVEYNLDWLKEKGFFEKTVPLALAGKDVLVDEKNSLAYAEVKNNEEIEEIKRGLSSHKVRYIWFYFPSESKLKTFRKIGEVKWFYYSPRMRGEYLKSRIDKLNKFSPTDMNILFDIKDVVNRFYWQLWEARIKMARSVKKIEEEKNKLLAVQHLIDRLIFFYFLAQLGLVSISSGNEKRIWKLDRTHTRQFFDWICGFLDDEKLQEFLNRVFFDVLGKSGGGGWSGLGFNIGGERFSVVAPSLNGGLFREEKIESIEESEIKIEGTRELIWGILNKYNWIIGEESPEEEDVIGDLTPEIIGHIYEKFVVSLEQIGLEKVDFDDIQTVKGELKLGRKKIGAYYTPEEITNYISMNTIYPYITDRINERFKRRYKNIWKELLNKKRLTEEDVEIVNFLYFDVLTQLRICDNACGSGSFLIAAGKVLLPLYSRVIKLLKYYQGEDEEAKEILEDIKRSPSRNYYIVRQIITNNLHGVDIMEGAVEIAKLRFWLWLISQVEPKEAEGRRIETLPNLDYNLLVGNSLIGFVDIKDIAKTLSSWLGESEEEWLKNLAKEKQKFKTLSARDAERLKEKLDEEIKKARVFLNRRFFEIAKAKGIEMPYEGYEGFAEDLKPFHWGFEFYDAFDLDKSKEERGFDIIIGNPPYGNILGETEKTYLKSELGTLEGQNGSSNTASVFIERSYYQLAKRAYLGYIIPNAISRVKQFEKIRSFILNKTRVVELFDQFSPFVGVALEMMIITFEKKEINDYQIITKSNKIKGIWRVPKSFCFKKDYIPLYFDDSLYNRIFGNVQYGLIRPLQGRPRKADYVKNGESGIRCISSRMIDPFMLKLDKDKHRVVPNDFNCIEEELDKDYLITPYFFGSDLSSIERDVFEVTIKPKGYITDGNAILLITDEKHKKVLLLFLNSELANYIMKRFILNYSIRDITIRDYELSKLPIKLPQKPAAFITLCDYMLFLNETEERRKNEKELIEFVDKQVIDALVYELYFGEKFEEEELKTNLLGLVEPYLGDIDNLKTEEEKLKVIKEVEDWIKADYRVMKEIERIKNHEWINVIERKSD